MAAVAALVAIIGLALLWDGSSRNFAEHGYGRKFSTSSSFAPSHTSDEKASGSSMNARGRGGAVVKQ